MAKIVLGVATSHTPLLTLEGADWHNRGTADRKNQNLTLADGQRVNYDTLVALRGEPWGDDCMLANFERIAGRCQTHLDRIAADIAEARPDVIVIIGDDQDELYSPGNMPAIALYWGAQVVTHSIDDELPAWMQTVAEGYGMDKTHIFPGHPDLALDVVNSMMEQEVDLAIADKVPNPKIAGFGHAFGFPAERLFGDREIPMIPILLNTYFPPNVMTPKRCWDVGTRLRRAIEASPLDLRVAILASGGLSHFVVEEEFDREVMQGLAEPDGARLRNLPRCALLEGTSEVLNWVMTAGTVSPMPLAWGAYEAVRRTPAGTGIGCGFAVWKPA